MKKKGFGMVEAVISVAIATALILVLSGVNLTYVRLAYGQSNKIEATFLAEESLEAVRFLRDENWTLNILPLVVGTNYYPVFNANAWQLGSTPTTFGIFDRKIVLGAVYRGVNGDIVSSGGTLDPNTYLVTSSVSWQEKGTTRTEIIATYITKLFDN